MRIIKITKKIREFTIYNEREKLEEV